MKQRHSYCRLAVHLVFHTKYREHLIRKPSDLEFLFDAMKKKAHDLDCYIEEFGGWRDHCHLLAQLRATVRLSDLYSQLKGYSAKAWMKCFPERPYKWGDGVYAKTVDPDRCDDLRRYIRRQWSRHESGLLVPEWERELEQD